MSLTYPFLTQSTAFLKTPFFPSIITYWNKLDINLRNSRNLFIFKKHILQFIRSSSNSVYKSHNRKGINLMNRFRLGLSHLREHKFKHSFQDSIDPLCNYNYKVKSTIHFFLHCPLFTSAKITLFSTLHKVDSKLFDNTDSLLKNISIFGKESLNTNQNMTILIATIEFIL